MSYQLIIGDKLYSSWSLRGALALELAGVPYEETLIKLNQPDTRKRILEFSATGKVPLLKTEHGVIADSWPSPSTSTNATPRPSCGRQMLPRVPRPARPVRRCTAASSPCAVPCRST